MPRFFVDKNQIEDGYITICGDDAHHISRSLRMAAGEHITVSDTDNCEYDCVLEDFFDEAVRARVVSTSISNVEPTLMIHLFQALPKGDKLDFIIQKAVECGAFDITPFESERCIARSKPETESRKTERRNKIALEAAKQSGRGVVPNVRPTIGFNEMISEALCSDMVLFCYEGVGTMPIGAALSEAKKKQITDIALIIGSEGGFSVSEAECAEKAGFCKVGLGKRILRTETASVFALGCIAYEFELRSDS